MNYQSKNQDFSKKESEQIVQIFDELEAELNQYKEKCSELQNKYENYEQNIQQKDAELMRMKQLNDQANQKMLEIQISHNKIQSEQDALKEQINKQQLSEQTFESEIRKEKETSLQYFMELERYKQKQEELHVQQPIQYTNELFEYLQKELKEHELKEITFNIQDKIQINNLKEDNRKYKDVNQTLLQELQIQISEIVSLKNFIQNQNQQFLKSQTNFDVQVRQLQSEYHDSQLQLHNNMLSHDYEKKEFYQQIEQFKELFKQEKQNNLELINQLKLYKQQIQNHTNEQGQPLSEEIEKLKNLNLQLQEKLLQQSLSLLDNKKMSQNATKPNDEEIGFYDKNLNQTAQRANQASYPNQNLSQEQQTIKQNLETNLQVVFIRQEFEQKLISFQRQYAEMIKNPENQLNQIQMLKIIDSTRDHVNQTSVQLKSCQNEIKLLFNKLSKNLVQQSNTQQNFGNQIQNDEDFGFNTQILQQKQQVNILNTQTTFSQNSSSLQENQNVPQIQRNDIQKKQSFANNYSFNFDQIQQQSSVIKLKGYLKITIPKADNIHQINQNSKTQIVLSLENKGLNIKTFYSPSLEGKYPQWNYCENKKVEILNAEFIPSFYIHLQDVNNNNAFLGDCMLTKEQVQSRLVNKGKTQNFLLDLANNKNTKVDYPITGKLHVQLIFIPDIL